MKKALFLLLMIAFVSACNKSAEPDLSKMFLYENRAFSLYFPTQDWKLMPLQGIDSYFGYYEKGNDKIYFDHGWYNGVIDKNANPKPLYYEETRINGNKAVIAKEQGSTGVSLRVIIYHKDKMNSTALSILNPTDEQEIISIFRTHQFKK